MLLLLFVDSVLRRQFKVYLFYRQSMIVMYSDIISDIIIICIFQYLLTLYFMNRTEQQSVLVSGVSTPVTKIQESASVVMVTTWNMVHVKVCYNFISSLLLFYTDTRRPLYVEKVFFVNSFIRGIKVCNVRISFNCYK